MSKGSQLVIYGGGHLGRQTLTHVVHHFPTDRVVGFVDDVLEPGALVARDLRCLGGLDWASSSERYGVEQVEVVFAIGYADMAARGKALDAVLDHGYRLFSVIHPHAMVDPSATVGQGCIVLAGAIIDQGASLEVGCYVDIGVRVGEDAVLGQGGYAASGASLGGSVVVGRDCFLGMDCTITTGVTVGRGCFVNAKSLVSRDLRDGVRLVEMHKSRELPNA